MVGWLLADTPRAPFPAAACLVAQALEMHGFVLRLPAATPALRAQLEALPAFGGKPLRACAS